MPFTIKQRGSDDALKIIQATQEGLLNAKEAVDENLYYQKEGLKELQASPEENKETIVAYKDDIAKIEKSCLNVDSRINRIEMISDQKEPSFFLIPASITKGEIKELMVNIESQLNNTKDSAQTRFLETLRETAESCKEYISSNQPFEDQYIPILEREKAYGVVLITMTKLSGFMNESSPAVSSDFKIIQEMYDQAVKSKIHVGFAGRESDFLKKFQNNIEDIINNSPLSAPQIMQEIQLRTAEHIKNLDSRVSFSHEFKKFINTLCEGFNKLNTQIKIPVLFSNTNIKDSLVDKFKQLKADFHINKTASVSENEKKNTQNQQEEIAPKQPIRR